MIACQPKTLKTALLLLVFSAVSFIHISAQDGKALFQSKCATCHSLYRDGTGPALKGFESRGPWGDRAELHKWVKNPAGYMATSAYTQGLLADYKSMMTAFPTLTNEEIDAIAQYIIDAPAEPVKAGGTTTEGGGDAGTGGGSALLYGILSLILALIALILMYVNSNLKKLSDDKEGIQRPEPVPFYRNKVYIAMTAIVFFVIGGLFLAKGAITLGRQQDYKPEQPIYYSHKVHVGINQINCLYCHGNAMESKHAAIPSVNVCMNCHKSITSYELGPTLYDEDGKEIDGTAEIAKLHEYAGFDPAFPNDWDPSKAKPIEWIKIHNLPDHVYFNHAQHVAVGNVQCQTCHGPIQDMDEVYQFSDLSMGWCVNCHRETKVNFFNESDSSGNRFYSIYEKFHNDMKNNKMDSVTVENIGGTECQKCHY